MADAEEEEDESVENAHENSTERKKFQWGPLNGCSLVVIRDHAFNHEESIVFPPSNHENLQHHHNHHHHLSIPNTHHCGDDGIDHVSSFLSYGREHVTPPSPSTLSSSSSSSSECFSPSDYNSLPNTPLKRGTSSVDAAKCCWWRLAARNLHDKVNGVWMYFRRFRFSEGLFSTFQSPVGIAAVLLCLLYFRWRRRQRRRLGEGEWSNEHLLRLIREKDERINQLLYQIARLNEVLLELHTVPSSKTG